MVSGKENGAGGLVAKACPTLVTPWTVACQAPLSMRILQARILEWLTLPSPENIPNPGTESGLLHCRQILYRLSDKGRPKRRERHSNFLLVLIQ